MVSRIACARLVPDDRDYSAAADAERAEVIKALLAYTHAAPDWLLAQAKQIVVELGGVP